MGKVKKKRAQKLSTDDLLRFMSIAIILLVISYVVFLQYEKIIRNRILEEKCDAIERSPDLLFDCDCFPTPEKKNTHDYVENKTEAFCTCVCKISENQTYTIEVRIAR